MNGAVGRFGEVVLVGALTFLCSLPVATITAAQAAAFHTLDPRYAGASGLSGIYLRAFRDHCRRGVVVQLVWAVPAVIAIVDLWFGLSAPAGSLVRPVFCGLGGVLLIFAMIMRPFLAARLAADREQPIPIMVRSTMVLAGVSPWRTLLVLALDVLTVAAGILTLASVPFLAGFALALQVRMIRTADDGIARRIAVRWR